MKKFSRLATLLVLTVSFSTPLLASAQFDYACNPPCLANQFCNSNNVCVSNSTLTQQSTTGGVNLNVIKPYSDSIIGLVNNILVPVLMAIAFIVFLWGVFKYFIWGAESDTERATGKQFVLWGIIGFVVILCVWGLVAIVTGTLNLTPGGKAPNTPTL
ncbi:MAG: pilin [bacterium]|nr:pilin [bacterium]